MSVLSLPPEIIDQILSYIDQIPHLVSFGLSSKDAARHVIPRHTEYRFLQTTFPKFPVWLHLSQHANLTRNIRHVHLFDRNGNPFTDRFPNTLILSSGTTTVGPTAGDHWVDHFDEKAYDAEPKYLRAVWRSLTYMDMLTTFVWSTKPPPRYPTNDYRWEFAILDVLSRKSSTLKHLFLGGGFARYTNTIKEDPESIRYPGWRFTNLTTLALHGAEWFTPNNSPHLQHLLSRNPSLEHLDIPMEFTLLANCTFPKLKTLKLTLTSGAPIFIDTIHIQFLARHESIENLYWYPIGNNMVLPPKFLPNLKRLSTDISLAEALYANELPAQNALPDSSDIPTPRTFTPRRIECLIIRSLPASLIHTLSETSHSLTSLHTLIIHSLHHSDPINRIPILFPNITHLHLPSAALGPSYERMVFTLDGWMSLLPQFTHLQVLRGSGIWETLRLLQEQLAAKKMEESSRGKEQEKDDKGKSRTEWRDALDGIVRACPNLRELDDYRRDEEIGDFVRIVIGRKLVEDTQHIIAYHLRRPKPVSVFDIFSGAFD